MSGDECGDLSVLQRVIYDLEGALWDVEHQFNPNDGGVIARTLSRSIKRLSEIDNEKEQGTNA